MLYCIKCEKMDKVEWAPMVDLFHLNTIRVSNSFDPGSAFDLEVCEFPDGWAVCPPPEFDMDEWMLTWWKELPLADIADQYLAYGYDVETDQIVTEVQDA